MNAGEEPSIGALFQQLVDDGKGTVAAEIRLYREIAAYRAARARGGLVAIVVAALLSHAALIALMVAFVLGLAPIVGPVAGGAIVLAATGLIAFLLVRWGAGKLSALGGDAEERAVLAAAEHRL